MSSFVMHVFLKALPCLNSILGLVSKLTSTIVRCSLRGGINWNLTVKMLVGSLINWVACVFTFVCAPILYLYQKAKKTNR